MLRDLFSITALAAITLATLGPADAGQAPGAAAAAAVPISHRDRVYSAEQFSNTISVIDNKNLGVIRRDTESGNLSTKSPIVVSTCAVSSVYDPYAMWLQLTFRNTDDVVATQVAFDVTHGDGHTTVVDRGRFSKGVTIEGVFFDEFPDGGYYAGSDTCTVAAITFADGRRWTAPGYTTTSKLR